MIQISEFLQTYQVHSISNRGKKAEKIIFFQTYLNIVMWRWKIIVYDSDRGLHVHMILFYYVIGSWYVAKYDLLESINMTIMRSLSYLSFSLVDFSNSLHWFNSNATSVVCIFVFILSKLNSKLKSHREAGVFRYIGFFKLLVKMIMEGKIYFLNSFYQIY